MTLYILQGFHPITWWLAGFFSDPQELCKPRKLQRSVFFLSILCFRKMQQGSFDLSQMIWIHKWNDISLDMETLWWFVSTRLGSRRRDTIGSFPEICQEEDRTAIRSEHSIHNEFYAMSIWLLAKIWRYTCLHSSRESIYCSFGHGCVQPGWSFWRGGLIKLHQTSRLKETGVGG